MVDKWKVGEVGTRAFALALGQVCDKGKVSLWSMSLQLFLIIKELNIEHNISHQYYLTFKLFGGRLHGNNNQELICCDRTKLVTKMKLKY